MLNQDYKEMLSILLEEKVEFLLVGAYALAAHGFPRATGDIDIFIRPSFINSQKVHKSLLKFGTPMGNINTNDFEKSGVIFQIGIAPRRIDIINDIDGVSFDSAFEDKIIVEIDGLKIPIISKEKMIKNKESTGRDQDTLDAKMLKNS
ncbi:MAG: nucleotidyltransferase [Candidatus Marinimicrobia bacterium]|nr:nucleotidyltransferase [Candidatus Neomarinimicrobiota bacterium]